MTAEALDKSEIGTRLTSVTAYVQDCERRVLMGEIMDLQGLDRNIIILCDAIAALPQEEAKTYEDRMATLIEKLEVLAQSMRAQHEKMTGGGG